METEILSPCVRVCGKMVLQHTDGALVCFPLAVLCFHNGPEGKSKHALMQRAFGAKFEKLYYSWIRFMSGAKRVLNKDLIRTPYTVINRTKFVI